jgi:phosphoribosylformimino-5-aminoimidazole carboxamide ribonucleotide (ProFAR) isomerase
VSCAGASSTRAASARSRTCARLAALRQVNLGGVIVGKALYEKRSRSPRARRRSTGAMLLKRVIPCLDVDAGPRREGHELRRPARRRRPGRAGARYDAEGADELVFLDITASHEKRDTIVELARRTADEVFIPFTIGGGIRSVEDAPACSTPAPTRCR